MTRHLCSIVTCIRDERREDLHEWIEWYLQLGVTRFVICDDQSREHAGPLVQEYADVCEVIRYEPPQQVHRRQLDFFTEHVQRIARETTWVACLDLDEFLILRRHTSLHDFLDEFAFAAAVSLNWKTFGSDGHTQRPDGLVIENYRRCVRDAHVKTIARAALVDSYPDAHLPRLFGGRHSVDTRARPILTRCTMTATSNRLHQPYFTKSRDEFDLKVARGRPDIEGTRSPDELDLIDAKLDEVELLALERADAVREAVARRAGLRPAAP